MSSQEPNPVFETLYSPPYSGPVSSAGFGRWIEVPDRGIYWTNDDDRVGFLSSSDSSTSTKDYAHFNELKVYAKSVDMSTSVLFDELVELIEDETGESPLIVQGDLSTLSTEPTTGDIEEDTTPPNERVRPETTDTFGVTVDDMDNVLEFVKINNEGTFLRDGDEWVKIDPDGEEEDYPTYYGQIYHDVSPEAETVYNATKDEESVSLVEYRPFIINE